MDESSAELECLGKSQKKTTYEDILETLGHSFECYYGYHTKCCRKCTAVSVSQSTKRSASTVSTRSKVPLNRATQNNESSKSNVLPNLCVFCTKGCKKFKGNIIDIGKCETFDADATIRNDAKCLKDETLLAKIGSCEFGNGRDFVGMEAKYHHVCKQEYTNKAREAKNSEKSNLPSEKKATSAALNNLIAFVNKGVIEKTHQRKYLSC